MFKLLKSFSFGGPLGVRGTILARRQQLCICATLEILARSLMGPPANIRIFLLDGGPDLLIRGDVLIPLLLVFRHV